VGGLLLHRRPTEGATGRSIHTWNEGLGSLTAHITDHSGVASQCTYASDLVNRSFSLPANGSFDVVIAPAVPAFRSWDVSVSCDNGAVANTSKFY